MTQPQSEYPDYQVGDEIEFVSGESTGFIRKVIHFEDGYVYYTAKQKSGGFSTVPSCGHDRIVNFRKAVTKFKVGGSYVNVHPGGKSTYTCIDIEGEWAILKYTVFHGINRVYAFATKTAAATNYKEVVG